MNTIKGDSTMEPTPLPAFNFTRDQSLDQFAVSAASWIQSNAKPWDGVATGALVFDSQNRILLVQRTPHDSMPNLWEVPGGAVDPEDESILHGCARELWEEAGLTARNMGSLVTEGPGLPMYQEFRNSTKTKLIGKFQFEVDVEGGQEVRLDANEHQDFVWATEEEVLKGEAGGRRLVFTKERHKDVILETFRGRRGPGSGADGS